MTDDSKPSMMLWLDDHRGVYIPRDFANSFIDRDKHVSGVSAEDWAILELGPDYENEEGVTVSNEPYWDTWTDVCDDAIVTNTDGAKFRLYQDGALWLIPEGMQWNDETDSFDYPEDRETDETSED